MSSAALTQWETTRRRQLDEIEGAHRAVEGSGPGRRYATQQINYAYAVLLSSQFQGFCRDLHSEAANFVAARIAPARIATSYRLAIASDRKLDRGNPNPANIGADFARFGISFWAQVRQLDRRNPAREALLEQLNLWRNAIAHQDWTRVGGSSRLLLGRVRSWRAACMALGRGFDVALETHLAGMVGQTPW